MLNDRVAKSNIRITRSLISINKTLFSVSTQMNTFSEFLSAHEQNLGYFNSPIGCPQVSTDSLMPSLQLLLGQHYGLIY